MSKRIERVNETITREAAQILQRLLGGQPFFVTIVEVDTAPNLASAKVHVRIFPKEYEDQARALLQQLLPKVQAQLGERMKIRRVPRLLLAFEAVREDIAETEKLLDELGKKYGE